MATCTISTSITKSKNHIKHVGGFSLRIILCQRERGLHSHVTWMIEILRMCMYLHVGAPGLCISNPNLEG
jgi:hypothetical protein